MNNPFTFGNPIREPERFYGRQAELGQIVTRLLSGALESTSVIGERRSGKTSLLKYLAHEQGASRLGLAPGRYCTVYIDFEGLTDITPARFWQRVLGLLGRSLCSPALDETIQAFRKLENYDVFDLEDVFQAVDNLGVKVVLLMDEFEYVIQNPNFGVSFFAGLRSIAINYPLALVSATRRELVDLCHSDEIKGSPFFNIFATVFLRPFSPAEVQDLLDGYTGGSDMAFEPQEKGLVLRIAGGYPIFVQIAGHFLWEGKRQGLSGQALLDYTRKNFEQQADPHFSYLWNQCSESEKITLLAILALGQEKPGKKSTPNLENIGRVHRRAQLDLAELCKRGLVIENEEIFALFSPSLAVWVAGEVLAAPGQEETPASVDAWLHGGGRDSLQPVKGALPRFKKKYWPILETVLREVSFEMIGSTAFELIVKGLA
ncbi:MAG: AAA family ATPase [Chloroflexota bacterium]